MTTKEQAIAQADAHADSRWMQSAVLALHEAAVRHPSLTADEVWESMTGLLWSHLAQAPTAMGPVMRRGQAKGWIERTPAFRPSRQAANHHRPVRIWRSLIWERGGSES